MPFGTCETQKQDKTRPFEFLSVLSFYPFPLSKAKGSKIFFKDWHACSRGSSSSRVLSSVGLAQLLRTSF